MASPGSVVIQFIAKADQARRDVLKFAGSLGDVNDEADTVDTALTDVQRGLDKTGTAARDSTRDLEHSETGFTDLGGEAETAARRLRQAASQMADGVRTGAHDIDTETGNIRDNMKESGKEAGAEFIGNVAEGIGSGTANVTEVLQGTLGGLTNLAASLGGPIGVAAGAAAGAIGLLFAKMQADADKVKARIQGMTQALIDTANESEAVRKKAVWDAWVGALTDGDKIIDDIAAGLRGLGAPAGLFQEALTGNVAAQRDLKALIEQTATKLAEQSKNGKPLTEEQRKQVEHQSRIVQLLDEAGISMDDSKKKLADLELLTGDSAEAAKRYADNLNDAKSEAGGIKKELDKIPHNIPVNVIVTMKDKNGRPVHLGPGQDSALSSQRLSAQAVPQSVVTVNVKGVPSIDSPRALKALLEANDTRMGRKPMQARAVAW